MRLLVLVLNILAGSSLLAQSTQILAAPVDTKSNKKNHHREQAARLHGKNIDPGLFSVKQKKLQNPGDVWERIRSGMQIPRPEHVETLSYQNINNLAEPSVTLTRPHIRVVLYPNTFNSTENRNSEISPQSARDRAERMPGLKKLRLPVTASAPLNNYTPYGRLKLNAALSSRIRNNLASPVLTIASKNAELEKDTAALVRLHSRININTKFSKHFGNSINTSYPVRRGLYDPASKPAKEAIKYKRVSKHIIWYTQHQDYLHQVAERARPYLYHIVESLSKHKLPHELALLPIVESAYLPTALSPKSAAGLWQFIPSTGHDFNLHKNDHYDARLDIAASTQAAIAYLSFLNQHFNGDWLLALAAYNCGLGAVDDAIKRNIAEGLDTDYWSLRLPEETQEYVPRFLALSSIFANPGAHGLKLSPVRNEPYFVKVKIDRKHDIDYLAKKDFKAVAQLANLSYEQFNRLNPGYLNPELPAEGPFTFLLPPANANQLHQRLASITQFLNQSPAMTTSHAPLKIKALSTIDEQKIATSLLTEITISKETDFTIASDPFLSLNLNINQTTPRIANQPLISPVDLDTDPKQERKNI
jgi:soluble lytic murein transglycosylase-like protein